MAAVVVVIRGGKSEQLQREREGVKIQLRREKKSDGKISVIFLRASFLEVYCMYCTIRREERETAPLDMTFE